MSPPSEKVRGTRLPCPHLIAPMVYIDQSSSSMLVGQVFCLVPPGTLCFCCGLLFKTSLAAFLSATTMLVYNCSRMPLCCWFLHLGLSHYVISLDKGILRARSCYSVDNSVFVPVPLFQFIFFSCCVMSSQTRV